jgi:aspartyl-tRNA(Asn)/glutamyl-tRNA(Gln) amidotransferase subunit A
MANIENMSAIEIISSLQNKEFSALELAEETFKNIEEKDKVLNCFTETSKELAREAAKETDKRINEDGFNKGEFLLDGIPVGFKDNMNLEGTFTTCSSKMLKNYKSTYTATCVQNMIDAGALPVGKLNMDEFAFGSSTETSVFGPSKNPHDVERVPGGSSGGSAAAVASGMLPIALGSDTGGSIRQPASLCGVIGIKPTYGLVSRYGVVAFGSSLDQVGPFARTMQDAALAMNALCKKDVKDCTSQGCSTDFTKVIDGDVKGMKIGIVKSFLEAEGLTSEVKHKIEEVAEKFKEAGAQIVEVELPNAKAAISAYYVLGPCEAFSNLARFDSVRYGYCAEGHESLAGQYEESRKVGFGEEARRRIFLGSYLLSAGVYEKYYYPAQKVRTLITRDYEQAFENVDVILSPASPRTAFKFGEITDPAQMYLSDMFTISINIAGNGGMSFPVGNGEDSGLPIGAQLIAPAFKDENMLRAASALEKVYGSAQIAN